MTTENTAVAQPINPPISSIFPPQKAIMLSDGRTFVIKPFRFLQMADAARCLSTVGGAIAMHDVLGMMTALVEAGEPAAKLVQMATGMTDADMANLESDDGVHLLSAVLEVNADFFARRTMTALSQLLIVVAKTLTPDPGSKAGFQDMTQAAAEPEPTETAGPPVPLH